MNRIALVEDHDRMAALIVTALSNGGIEVEVFNCIASARSAVAQLPFSAIVIDRGLPDGDGLDLVRQLRADGNFTPCLMLTARDALRDRIEGLDLGADDYIAKPFAMDELLARVRALLRRPAIVQSLTPEFAGLKIFPDQSSMNRGEETISLAPAELQIMLTLVKAKGRMVRRNALEAAGWGFESVTPNAIDVALHRLRRKLVAIDSSLQILNVRGQGYELRESKDAP